LIAGPDRPPWLLPITGRRSMSMAMPIRVLITAKPSVPASMQRRAFSAMSVWLGDSLVISGLPVTARQASTTRADMSGSLPKATPPSFTFGQEMLISMASIGESSKRRVTSIVFLDRRAGDVGDEARLAEIERRQDLVDHVIHAGILQADRVQHAIGVS
jgi:hypothetical protein